MQDVINKELLFVLLRRGVKTLGMHDPDEVLNYIEEDMTPDEYNAAKAFLKWLVENNKTFGHNIPQVFAEFEKSLR